MYIIPAINGSFAEKEGTYRLPEAMAPLPCGKIGEVFQERLSHLGDYRFCADGAQAIRMEHSEELPEEGYRLHITKDGFRIEASGAKGIIPALTTVFQLAAEGKGTLPCAEIEDRPRYTWRGLHFDSCRHFFPVEEILKLIEQAALLKLNRFHWHLSDDQGYRIESKVFPELNSIGSYRALARLDPAVQLENRQPRERYGGYYTQEEIRRVVAFAAQRGIEVVPELDVPGHSSAILAAFPQLTCSGAPVAVRNTFGVHARIFCAGSEEAYEFITRLLDEIFSLFPSQYIHLGGDEAPKDEWKKCPRCAARMRAEGITSYEALQASFSSRLAAYAKSKGKTPIFWNESLISGTLCSDGLIQYWAEMAPGPSYAVKAAQEGRRFILSNMDKFYCTDSYAMLPLRSTLLYEPNLKGTPIPDESVEGVEMAMWTEWTPRAEDIEPQMYPRMLAAAECAWTKQKDEAEFMARAKAFIAIDGVNLLAAENWEKVTVSGDKALEEIAFGLLSQGAKYSQLSAAEAEDGGEAGYVGAVTPEGSEPIDPIAMVHGYVADKMSGIYSEEDINHVTKIILQVLTDCGYAETAYRMLENEECPGWLYEVKKGASTVWEGWDAIDPRSGKLKPLSLNHYAPGAAIGWLYSHCAGIRPLSPGFRKIEIHPVPGGKMTWAKAAFESQSGPIASEWERKDGTFTLRVSIPDGVEATVILPDESVFESAHSGEYSCEYRKE